MTAKPLSSSRVLAITGAGISAESGIPTFRGPGGYWRNFDPAKLATESAFRANPALVWEWYRERRAGIRRATPNPAHVALVELASHAGEFLLLTQNVDDLHARAEWNGQHLPDAQRVQIHGDIFVSRCTRCDYQRREVTADADSAPIPCCPECSSALRPGVVWFGESLPCAALGRMDEFLGRGPCDLTLVIGTSALFGYIVDWATRGVDAGGELIEINPEPSPVSAFATTRLRGAAASLFPRWVAERRDS